MANKPTQLQLFVYELRQKWFMLNNRVMAAAFTWLGNKLIRRFHCGESTGCLTCDVGAAHDELPLLSAAFNAGYKAAQDSNK